MAISPILKPTQTATSTSSRTDAVVYCVLNKCQILEDTVDLFLTDENNRMISGACTKALFTDFYKRNQNYLGGYDVGSINSKVLNIPVRIEKNEKFKVNQFTIKSMTINLSLSNLPQSIGPNGDSNKLLRSMFTPMPVPFYGDEYTYKNKMRIGYSVFSSPILSVEKSSGSYFQRKYMLRTSGSTKKGTGDVFESFTISLNVGREEVATSLLPLLKQVSLTPFLTAEGGCFGIQDVHGADGDVPWNEIAIRNVTVSTLPGYPHNLRVDIDFEPFVWSHFVPPAVAVEGEKYNRDRLIMDDFICWPLFKIWSEQKAFPRYDATQHLLGFGGSLTCAFPSDDFIANLPDIVLKTDSVNPVTKDIATFNTLVYGFMANNSAAYSADTVRQIYPNYTSTDISPDFSYYVMKLDSEDSYNQIAGQLRSPAPGGVATLPQLVGLIQWNKLASYSYYDDTRGLIPLPVSAEQLQEVNAFKRTTWYDALGCVDIAVPGSKSVGGITAPSFETQIASFVGSTTGVIQNDSTQALINNMLQSPWEYFAVVLRANPNDKELQDKLLQIKNNLAKKAQFDKPLPSVSQALQESYKKFGPDTRDNGKYIYRLDEKGSDGHVLVEQISATRGHNLSLIDTLNSVLPIHQYMGGLDATVVVKGKCFGLEGKQIIENMKAECDNRNKFRMTRRYLTNQEDKKLETRTKTFLKVDNEIFQLMGIEFAVPITYVIKNVQGQPNVWDFTITFVDMNFKTLLVERVRYLQTFSENVNKTLEIGWQNESTGLSPFVQKALDWQDLQKKLRGEEVYPDMNLPTLGEIDFWVDSCIKIATQYKQFWGKAAKAKTAVDWDEIYTNTINKLTQPGVQQIASIIRPFLENNLHNINVMTDPDLWQSINSRAAFSTLFSNGLFGEPDFYCYYYSNEYVNNRHNPMHASYDLIAPSVTGGKPANSPNLGVSAPLDDNVPGAPTMVLVDQVHGTTTLLDNSYFTGQSFNTILDSIQTQTFAVNDTEWQDKVKQIQAAAAVIDAHPDSWWIRKDGVQNGAQVLFTVPRGYVGDALKNPQAKVLLFEQNPYGSQDSTKYPGGQDIYSLEYRRAFLRKLAATAGTHSVALENQDLHNYQTKGSFWEDYNVDKYAANGENGFLAWEEHETDLAVRPDPDSTNGTISVRTTTEKAFYATNLYQYYLDRTEGIDLPDVGGPSPQARFLAVRKGVMSLVNRATDPNIILSYLFTRGGFGFYTSNDSTVSQFGQVSKSFWAGAEPTPAQVIATVDSAYADALDTYSIPSAALIAMDYYLQTGQKLSAANSLKLKNSVAAYKGVPALDSDGQIAAINQLVAENGSLQGAILLDRFYANYIQLAKTFGTVVSSTPTDIYFDPLNALILQDEILGSDGNPQKQSTVFTTDFTPSGRTININASAQDGVVLAPSDPVAGAVTDLNNQSPVDIERNMAKYDLLLKPTSEAGTRGAVEDMLKYSSYGRLAGAFPAYQVLIINEGFYWQGGHRKLWDQFYTRTGVTEIEVFKSRTSPTHSCRIEFSNVFFTLTSYPLIEAMAQQYSLYVQNKMRPDHIVKDVTSELWNALITKDIPDDVKRIWKNNHLKQLALTPGARLQIRMGYGSDASALPVVFNGVIVDCPVSDGTLEVYAAGDGIELEKQLTHKMVNNRNGYAYSDGGALGIGKDPSSIVADSMTACSLFDNITGGQWRDLSKGVSHFGDVYYGADLLFRPTEILQNIYSSTPGKLEQAIPAWKNWLNINAIYNFDGSIGIAVDVEEPTPWKVIQTCRLAVPDFVASVEPFATRSTLFFGKWWWPFYYDYDASMYQLATPVDPQTKKFEAQTNSKTLTAQKQRVADDTNQLKSNPELIKAMDEFIRPYRLLFVSTPDELNRSGLQETGDFIENLLTLQWNRLTQGVSSEYEATDKTDPNIITNVELFLPEMGVSKAQEWHLKRLDGTYFIITIDGANNRINALHSTSKPISENEFQIARANSIAATVHPQDGIYGGAAATDRLPQIYQYNFLKDTTDFVSHLKWKPFTQFHIAHSYINLLDNQIRLSTNKIATDAILEHRYNGLGGVESVERTLTFSVDDNISPSERKTMLVKSGLMVTALQGGLYHQVVGFVAPFVPLIGDGIKGTPTTPAVHNSVVAALADSVKNMYDGSFVMTGQASIKPHDIISLNDHKNNLKGPVFVRDVVHSISVERGFITTISPDIIAIPQHCMVGLEWVRGLLIGTVHRTTSFLMYKAATAATVGAVKRYVARRRLINNAVDSRVYDLLRQRFGRLDLSEFPEDFLAKMANFDAQLSEEVRGIREALDAGKDHPLITLAGGRQRAEDALHGYIDQRRRAWMSNNGVMDKLRELYPTHAAAADGLGEELANLIHLPPGKKFISEGEYLDRLIKQKTFMQEIRDTIQGARKITRGTAEVAVRSLSGKASGRKTVEQIAKEGLSKFKAGLAQAQPMLDTMKAVRAAKTVEEAEQIWKESKEISKIITAARELYSGVRMLAFTSAPEFTTIIAALQYVLTQQITDYFNAALDARHSVKIIPLMAGDVPFVGGIRGHAGAVIGDDPSWKDTLLNDIITPGAGSGWGWYATALPLSFMGIEMPRDTDNHVDKEALRQILESYESDAETDARVLHESSVMPLAPVTKDREAITQGD